MSPTEAPDVRLVVTGHDADNNGRFVSDRRVGPTPGLAADGWQAYVLWGVRSLPSLPDDGTSAIDTSASGRGSIRFVQTIVYPQGTGGPAGTADALTEIEKPAGGSAMHFTRTVDLVVVIEGEVEVVLDTERTTLRQGDFIVQNGTRHEWLNHTGQPAKLGVIVLGTEHKGFLCRKRCESRRSGHVTTF
jgi:mannose-6-phosphate isomerase-like protein (cupin superfamily)